MKVLNVDIYQLENGYVIRENDPGQCSSYLGKRSWVASNAAELEKVVGRLARSCEVGIEQTVKISDSLNIRKK